MSKRPDSEIMTEIQDCYCGLSPENISCDGERSFEQTRNAAKAIHKRLKVLFVEIGRHVTESEAFGHGR